MTARTRVVLADDHPVVRAGLRQILERHEDIEIVGEASDGNELLATVRSAVPDVVVTDVSMPELNGIDAIRGIRRERPAVRVVVLSVHCEERLVMEALGAGAVGYVLKEAATAELRSAVTAAARGEGYLSPPVAKIVLTRLTSPTREGGVLASREREVAQLISEGRTVRQIAAKLFISVATVKTHRANAMRKIGARTPADLVRYAIREGLASR